MRELKNKLTAGKNTKNTQHRKAKSFGYQILGFGSGGAGGGFIEATGGTITETGDFKVHTFTGPGTFTVETGGAGDNTTVDYLVIAGGAGGSWNRGGGGGAGGYRTNFPSSDSGLSVTAQDYPITVGGGGAGDTGGGGGGAGSNSIYHLPLATPIELVLYV